MNDTYLTSHEDLAMLYVIKKLAPDPGRELVGSILYLASRGGYPGVTVTVDWGAFLNEDPATIRGMRTWRLAEYKDEEAAEAARRLRSEQTKAGIQRKQRENPDWKPGRQAGATDLKPRKRGGYVIRGERQRGVRA